MILRHAYIMDTKGRTCYLGTQEHDAKDCGFEKEGTVNTKHTPTPWDQRPQSTGQAQIYGDNGKTVAITYYNDADAELIVRAVNSHEELLTLVKARLRDVKAGHIQDRETEISILERYISQAEGAQS